MEQNHYRFEPYANLRLNHLQWDYTSDDNEDNVFDFLSTFDDGKINDLQSTLGVRYHSSSTFSMNIGVITITNSDGAESVPLLSLTRHF